MASGLSAELIGRVVGSYRIARLLGTGAMGRVYLLEHLRLPNTFAALKVLSPQRGNAALLRERFVQEAMVAAAIGGDRVARPLDIGQFDDATPYIVMEYIEGRTLAEIIDSDGPLDLPLALDVAYCVADTIAQAHARGIVHRDLKPSNIMLADEQQARIKVLDFGVARAAGDIKLAQTMESAVIGSPGYMSPEAATGMTVDARTDVFSLAVTLFKMLTGTLPFFGESPQLLLAAMLTQPPARIADARAGGLAPVPPALEEIVGRALRRSMAERPTMAELRDELFTILAQLSPERAAELRRQAAAAPAPLPRDVDALGATLEHTTDSALVRALVERFADERMPWPAPSNGARARPRRRLVVALALAVALPCGLAAAALWRRHAGTREPPAVVRSLRRLTFAPGCEGMPGFAPDGNTLVYSHDGDDGDVQLYALDLAGGASRSLTRGPGFNMMPAVSPDGRYVAFAHNGDGPRELRVERLDGSDAPRTIAPLPLGGLVAWLSATEAGALDVQGNITGWRVDDPQPRPRVIRLPPGRNYWQMSAFDDGALAVNWREDDDHLGAGVLSGDGLRVLAEHVPYLEGGVLAAPSGNAIYVPRRNGQVNELVRIPRDGAEPQIVGGGVAPWWGTSISRDGSKLAFSTCKSNPHLVRVEDDNRLVPLMPIRDWRDQEARAIDERHLLFSSNRSGSEQAYLLDTVTQEARPVGPGGIGQLGDVSRDGRWFLHVMQSPPGIWLRAVDGAAPPRRLTEDVTDASPFFSHDDRQVIFERGTTFDTRLWIVPVAGGAPRQLVSMPARSAMPSRADERIFFMARTPVEQRLMMTDEHGAEPVAAPMGSTERSAGADWGLIRSRDGQRILIVHGGYQIVELYVDGKRPPRIKHQLRRWISDVTYAADDEHVIANVDFGEGDLWLAEGRFP